MHGSQWEEKSSFGGRYIYLSVYQALIAARYQAVYTPTSTSCEAYVYSFQKVFSADLVW